MSNAIRLEDARVDELAQDILVLLTDQPRSIPELQRLTHTEAYQTIRHRFKDHLVEAGLAEEIEGEHRTFRLTQLGQDFVTDHDLDATRLDQIREVAHDATDRVDTFEHRLQTLEGQLGELKSHDYVDMSEIERLEDRISNLKSAMTGEYSHYVFENNKDHIVKLFSRVDSIEKTLESHDDRISAAEKQIESLDKRIDGLADQVDAVAADAASESQVDEFETELQRLRTAIQGIQSDIKDLKKSQSGLFR